MPWFYVILGLLFLLAGGDILVRGAVGIAKRFRLSPLIIGLTIVSFGTSAPELMVSLQAALKGNPDIAIGNVVGSNIANLGLVLGLTVMIFPIVIDRNTLRIDWPVMMLASLLFWYFISDNVIDFTEGFIFVLVLSFYLFFLFFYSKKTSVADEPEKQESESSWLDGPTINLSMVALGCVGLVYGADFLVSGASDIARKWDISEHVIGVTIVAFGTSVPELATSCIAAFKKQTDISVGNLIGSNIFNVFAILGITSLVTPINLEDPAVLSRDIYWMLAISFAVFPLAIFGLKLQRWKGFLLFVAYIVFMYLIAENL
ncbi:MAG: calcium/sodium antiporter [Bacteroidota bacterium]